MMLLMHLTIIFICLFILFAISRHDFVLIRQNISLRQIFDNAFIIIVTSFMSARLGFILYSQKFELLSPLKYFYLTKYWGVLYFFGFISMTLVIYFLFRKKKNILRIYDIYFISFSPIILFDIILQNNGSVNLILKVISVSVLSLFYLWFIKINNKFTLKDGFITSIILITYSLVSLAFSFSNKGFLNFNFLWYQVILFLAVIFSAVLLFLVQRNFFNK